MSIPAAACFYIEGRDDAAEDFDVGDYDLASFAAAALTGDDDLREVLKQAIAADLATDAHDGTKDDWIKEHRDECEEAGVDVGVAYEEWCRGYMDRGALEIETAMDNGEDFEDALSDITAVETPAAKASTKKFGKVTRTKSNPISIGDDRGATYADYFATGIQDCQNTYADDEMDDEINAAVKKTGSAGLYDLAREAVDTWWKAAEPEAKQEWVAQNRADVEDAGLDVDKAYKEWSAGWKLQAAKYVEQEIMRRDRARKDED